MAKHELTKFNNFLSTTNIDSMSDEALTDILDRLGLVDSIGNNTEIRRMFFIGMMEISIKYKSARMINFMVRKGSIPMDRRSDIITLSIQSNDEDLMHAIKQFVTFDALSYVELSLSKNRDKSLKSIVMDSSFDDYIIDSDIFPFLATTGTKCFDVMVSYGKEKNMKFLDFWLSVYPPKDDVDRAIVLMDAVDNEVLSGNKNYVAKNLLNHFSDSPSATEKLISVLRKKPEVVKMAVKEGPTELLPEALRKIFLIKDKK